MQKIFRPVLDRLIKQQVSNVELSVLLYIARYQDDYGTVVGVHYKDVCDATGICPQSVYDALDGLESKQLISISSSHYGDRDILIIGNKDIYALAKTNGITLDNDEKIPFLNLHHKIFHNKNFYSLKVNSKLLIMLFMFLTEANKDKKNIDSNGCRPIRHEKFFKIYCQMFNVKKNTLRRYMTEIRHFFKIKLSKAVYNIVPKNNVFTRDEIKKKTDDDLLVENLAKVGLRRKPALQKNNPLLLSINLVKHLRKILNGHLRKPKICEAFLKAFSYLDADKDISYPYINKLLQNELKII